LFFKDRSDQKISAQGGIIRPAGARGAGPWAALTLFMAVFLAVFLLEWLPAGYGVQAAPPRFAALLETVPDDVPAEIATDFTAGLYQAFSGSPEWSLVVREWVQSHQNARVGKGCDDLDCAVQVGRGLGVDWVVVSTLERAGTGTWKARAYVVSVSQKKIERQVSYRHVGPLVGMVRKGPAELLTRLGAPVRDEPEQPPEALAGPVRRPGARIPAPAPGSPPGSALTSPHSSPQGPSQGISQGPSQGSQQGGPGPGEQEDKAPVPRFPKKSVTHEEVTAEATYGGVFPALTVVPVSQSFFRANSRDNSAPGTWDGQWEEIRVYGFALAYSHPLIQSGSQFVLLDLGMERGIVRTVLMPDEAGQRGVKEPASGVSTLFEAGLRYVRRSGPLLFGAGVGLFSGEMEYTIHDYLFAAGATRTRRYTMEGIRIKAGGDYLLGGGWAAGLNISLFDVVVLGGSRVDDYSAAGAAKPRMWGSSAALEVSRSF